MTANRYGNVLTIILIILILAILIGVGILGYNIIKKRNQENRTIVAIEEFDKVVEENEEEEIEQEEEEDDRDLKVEETERTEEETTSTQTRKKVYHEGFVMLGYITIPKTNIKYPILDTVSPEAIDTAVAALYPSSPQLNSPGNVVIIGHNYRDGRFFSNNKRLSIGDKIKIKDDRGKELTYTIYKVFETTPEDTSFYARNTNGAIEITLSTCTDDGKLRTIILARVEK